MSMWEPAGGLVGMVLAMIVLGEAGAGADTEKLVDTTLFAQNDVIFRWSEGSTINLDGEDHLLMAVTVFGGGGHDNSEARIVGFHSYDGGLTWPEADQAEVLQENVGEENTMSPALLLLDNGEILCFVNVKNEGWDCGPWVKRSTDGGVTWGPLERLHYEGYGCVGNDRAIQLRSGRVLLPCWVSMDGLGSSQVWVFYSDDHGRTWQRSPIVSTPPGSTGRKTDPAAEEPMIIELTDGRLMMIMRTYLKSIYRCYSSDGGATWTEPETSGIPSPGSMATIRRLPNGDILLIWNWAPLEAISGPWPRNFLTSAISTDDGRNFTSVRHLDGAADFEGKITMANVTFAGDDRVVITYSKSMSKKNAYNWQLQVIPLQWFYEGDMSQEYGERYVPTLEAYLEGLRAPTDAPAGGLTFAPISPEARADVLTNRVAQHAAADSQEAGLVASYHLDGREPGFAVDTSANGNDLRLFAAGGFPQWVEGRNGTALAFNGEGGFCAAPHAGSLAFDSGVLTLEAWVCPTARKAHSIIATKEHMFELGLLDGRLQAAVRAGGEWGPGWVGRTEIPLNEWTHIAMTFDQERIRLYVNGNETDSVARACRMDVTEEPFVVGGCTNIGDSVFAGRLDEIKVWQSVRYEPVDKAAFREASGEPRRVGGTHQLFVDDALIALNQGLERVVNRPAPHYDNPVLTYEKPWEGNCVITWGSVLYDEAEGRFKIWYEVYKKFPEHNDGTMVCYATSQDGVQWDKPELGLIDYLGSTANNIVLWLDEETIDAPSVLRVPGATPECAYRMYFYSGRHEGIRTATSAEGIHWAVREGTVIQAGDRSTAYYDSGRGVFRVLTRIPGRGERTIGIWESRDGEHFEAMGEVLAADAEDPEKTELYGMIAFNYESLWLGFLEPFFIPIRKLNTQLAYSRDGLEWHRACSRQTFLDYGPPGSWDQAWVTPSHNAPIRLGDRLYLFYQGRQTLHWAQKPYGHIGGVGLAFLRPDGFVSLDSQWEEGEVVTAPLLLEGNALHVNAFARPGQVRVEITDVEGHPIEGFTLADCVALENTDAVDYTMGWRGEHSLEGVRGRPIRLRLAVQGAKLYSFWCE
ncbi:MAG: exo-alpha-sialidase [Candidatus Hydrogenedentes bacterium]|nr:exo-alpha-sialidase [Candidatus Hydrogenedentota bacterium]